MSDEEDEKAKTSIKQDWEPSSGGGTSGALFTPDELDIYVNKVTLEAYIFHSKKINYTNIERLEYDPIKHTADIVNKDGTTLDLGVKIEWLVRPYFSKADEINIVQTKDGESIDGILIPLIHKQKTSE